MRKFLLWLIKIYQKFFTFFSYGSCRYYPTCSEYAKMQFEYNSIIIAFFAIQVRILKCNRLFEGGFDYPKVNKGIIKKPKLMWHINQKIKIFVWFVPADEKTFYIVKSLYKLL